MAKDPREILLRNAITLARVSNAISQDATGILAALFDDVVGDLAKIDPTAVGATTYKRARVAKLLERVEKATGESFTAYHKQLRGDLARLGRLQGQGAAKDLIATLGDGAAGKVKFAGPTQNMMKAILDANPFQGETLKGWAQVQEAATIRRIRQQVQLGMANEEPIGALIKRVRDIQQTTTREATALTRTAVNFTAGEAQYQTYSANPNVTEEWAYQSTLDSRTTDICISLDQQVFRYDDAAAPRPPQHWSCLPGDALVAARSGITGVSKRWFDGDVVIIKTAAGLELTCTPNHPVLTDEGWVPAGSLHLGSHVVCDGGGEWEPGAVHRHDEQVPARIHDVTESFLGSGKVLPVPVPTTAEDFHGDGMDGDVAVVGSYGLLRRDVKPPRPEGASQRTLCGRCADGLAPLPGQGGFAKGAVAPFATTGGLVGGGREASDLGGCRSGHARGLLLTPVAGGDALLTQDPCDNTGCAAEVLSHGAGAYPTAEHADHLSDGQVHKAPVFGLDARLPDNAVHHLEGYTVPLGDGGPCVTGPVARQDGGSVHVRTGATDGHTPRFQAGRYGGDSDTHLAREIVSGAAGPVFVDEVVNVEVQAFSGHVYNLETVGGYYTAQGVIVHNCRSAIAPVIKYEELGLTDPGEGTRFARDPVTGKAMQVPANQSYGDWLKSQPMAVKVDILGPGRARLFREGEIGVRDLVRGDGGRVTLAELEGRVGAGAGTSLYEQRDASLKFVRSHEWQIRNEAREHAAAFNPQTGERLFDITSNDANSVEIPGRLVPMLEDAVFTHNHPSGGPFSAADIFVAAEGNVLEMRAVGGRYTYSLVRPANGWPDASLLFEQAKGALYEAFRMDSDAYHAAVHQALGEMFAHSGIRYTRSVTRAVSAVAL